MTTTKKKSKPKAAEGVSMTKAKARGKKLAALIKSIEAVDVQARQEGQAIGALGRARSALLEAITLMSTGKSG